MVPRVGSTILAKVAFEYTGRTALTVLSPVTGKRYRFESRGSRIEADPRDRSMLQAIPGLKPIKAPSR